MRYGVLGPLVVWAEDGSAVPVPEAKVRALLACLLLRDGGPISVDRLVADLWGEAPPRNPANAVQAKVSQLRRVLGRDAVVHQPTGYRLRLHPGDLDAHRFGQLAHQSRSAEHARDRAKVLTDALALWRGAPYLDVADTVSARGEIARLEELRLSVLEDQAEARLELGEHAVVAAELADLVERHPLRERLRMTQMRALYQSGRQSEALTCFHDLRCRLDSELGVSPGPEITRLHDEILRQAPQLAVVRQGFRTNLPASVTTLVGRQDALDDVRSLVDAGSGDRAVTLVGPGGVGKTRLAVAAAHSLVPQYPDGVWLMEFAGVSRHAGDEDIAERIIATLGLCDSAASTPEPADNLGYLCSALAAKRPLLVLDNCEHVVEPVAAVVTSLLAASPGARVLVTSHEPLDIPGETVRPVTPLPVPADPARAEDSAAVELFVRRAAAAVPGFALDEHNTAAVVTICRRLDGIPLALELVAPGLRAFSPDELAARLDDRFVLPLGRGRGRPARQQTLRAMIDWSWELLGDAERTVLGGLAAHPDGCTLASATTVCVGLGVPAEDVLGIVSRLVDRSLVVRDGQRFRLLESVAAYCLDRLREAGELDRTRALFVRCYLEVAARADNGLRGADQSRCLRLLDTETVNLRRALDIADADQALALVNALAWYWFLRGRLPEARRSLAHALAMPGGSPSGRATARAWLAGFALRSGIPAEPEVQIDDPVSRARLQWFVGSAWDGAEGARMLADSLANARAAADRWAEAAALVDTGEHERAAVLFEELGDRWGQLRATRARPAPRADEHEKALRIAEELGLWTEVVETLCCLGDAAEDPVEARRFYDRARQISVDRSYARGESLAAKGIERLQPGTSAR